MLEYEKLKTKFEVEEKSKLELDKIQKKKNEQQKVISDTQSLVTHNKETSDKL